MTLEQFYYAMMIVIVSGTFGFAIGLEVRDDILSKPPQAPWWK